MDIVQLEYFRTIAEYEHLTRAAESLHITQPALSLALKKLEQEVGAPLFDRQGRNIRLNACGTIYLKHVNEALLALQTAAQELQDYVEMSSSVLTLGITSFLAIQPAIRAFAIRYPAVEIKQREHTVKDIFSCLNRGCCDLVITSIRDENPLLEARCLRRYPLLLAVPKAHPLAGRETVDLFELADESFVCVPEGHADRIFIDQACAEVGFRHRVTFEHFQSQMLSTVAEGVGIALVSDDKVRNAAYRDKVAFLKLSNPIRPRTTWLQWHKKLPLSKNAQKFRDFVTEYFAAQTAEADTQ